MKSCKVIVVFFIAAFISGCLANVRGEAVASQLNNQAVNEGSPYRWIVASSENDTALLKQEIIGEVGVTSATELQQKYILSRINNTESKDGKSAIPEFIEVRPISWFDAPMNYSLSGKNLEIWVFSNNDKTIAYKIDGEPHQIEISEPWVKASN